MIARLAAIQPWNAELAPIAIAAMILAIAYNPHFALMVTFGLSLLTSVAMNAGIGHFLVIMGGTSVGVLYLHEVRTRTKLIKVGGLCAMGFCVLTWATGLWQDQPINLIAVDSLWRAGWGLMAGFALGGMLPFVETGFGIVTGISLLGTGRYHASALLAGTGATGSRNAQPLNCRGYDCRGCLRTDRRQCLAGPNRRLFPRHRQDAQTPLLCREPGRRDQPSCQPGTQR